MKRKSFIFNSAVVPLTALCGVKLVKAAPEIHSGACKVFCYPATHGGERTRLVVMEGGEIVHTSDMPSYFTLSDCVARTMTMEDVRQPCFVYVKTAGNANGKAYIQKAKEYGRAWHSTPRPVDKSLSAVVDGEGTVTLTIGPGLEGTLDDIRICSSSPGDKPETIHISGWDAHGLPIEETIVLHNTPVTTKQAFRGAIIN